LHLNNTYNRKMPLFRISCAILLICNSLLMQACSTTEVIKTTIPGRELSRTSLGERVIDDKVMLDEVNPFSVILYRQVSTVEFAKIEYQAVTETRHEKTTYECSNAYDRYPAFLITTMAVPVLYEMVTGFDILRGMCEKNPPAATLVEAAETDQTLTRESFNKERIVTKAIPLAGEAVTIEIDGTMHTSSTSSAGIAALPEKEFAYLQNLQNSEKSVRIVYRYNDLKVATTFKKQVSPEESKAGKSSAEAKWIWNAASEDLSATAETGLADNIPSEYISGQPQIKPDPMNMIVDRHSAPGISAEKNLEPAQDSDQIAAVPSGIAPKSNAASESNEPIALSAGIRPDSFESKEWKFILNINFDTNRATIKKEYFSRLKEIGEILKKNPKMKGVIEGHTDNVGSKKFNLKMSIRRAEAVAQHLIKTFGIPADRLRVEGFGMSRPITENATLNGRSMNRRIEAKFKDLGDLP
jgi:outer membrane protein OmpA-like peptidoglycan-associated protein